MLIIDNKGDIMKNKKIVYIILFLTAAVLFLAFLNYRSLKVNVNEADSGVLYLKVQSREAKLQMENIKGLNAVEFEAVEDTSTGGPETHKYKGVQLKDIIKSIEPDFENLKLSRAVIKGVDGYAVALTSNEVLQDDNVYLVFEKDGKQMKGKKRGGSGPYQVIIRQDQFSQRWCKFVTEIVME
jgi:hypothetical protein